MAPGGSGEGTLAPQVRRHRWRSPGAQVLLAAHGGRQAARRSGCPGVVPRAMWGPGGTPSSAQQAERVGQAPWEMPGPPGAEGQNTWRRLQVSFQEATATNKNKLSSWRVSDRLPKEVLLAVPLVPIRQGPQELLGAEGLKVSDLHGPAADTWFPWLPEDYLFGLRSRCSGPEAGLGVWGLGCPLPLQSRPPGSRAQEGHGQLSRRHGQGASGEKWGGLPSASQRNPLPNLCLPQRQGRAGGDSVLAQSPGRREGEQERGHSPHPHPLSPGQLVRPGCSVPSALSWPPGVWAVLTSLLGWAAG